MDNPQPNNGAGKQIRLITEDGAFGQPGYMVIVRRWESPQAKIEKKRLRVDSYVVVTGDDAAQLKTIEEMKQSMIVDPLFASFTILKFISETRPLQDPSEEKPVIHIPTARDTRRFGRSKYDPQ